MTELFVLLVLLLLLYLVGENPDITGTWEVVWVLNSNYRVADMLLVLGSLATKVPGTQL